MASNRARTVAALNRLRPRIEAGADGRALVLAVDLCGMAMIPMPGWLATVFTRRVSVVLTSRAASWDDAFGRPWPNAKVAAVRHRRAVVMPRVNAAIQAAVRADPGVTIDKDFWERIGEEAGVGATAAENAYRESLAGYAPSIQSLRSNVAIAKAASEIIAKTPERAIDSDFFAEVSARTGVPHDEVAEWFRAAQDQGLTFSPDV
jgi:hypothetical protein